MLLGFVEVLSLRISSSWNLLCITSTDSMMGTFTKKEGASKLTMLEVHLDTTSSSSSPAMISTKCLLFLINESAKPAGGIQVGEYVWKAHGRGMELMQETIGLSGTPSLWTLRSPYILGGWQQEGFSRLSSPSLTSSCSHALSESSNFYFLCSCGSFLSIL